MSDQKEVAISVKDLHKKFVLPQNKSNSFKQLAVNIVRENNKVTQHVLDGVSFEVYKGDFFGIVGRNGSGKSTLLKLLAGVYTPTSGDVSVNGGLTPFIELGVGFNPELSGRDNVYLNGALLGYGRKQMDVMYDEIVEFAELGPFMDQKLKNYSSGMQVRLAFSIAIKAKNDVLIFDEVLAVGDEAFQRKCLDVFESYKAKGQTVILVTHDMDTVRRFCNRALILDKGKILKLGSPHEAASTYSELNLKEIEREMLKKEADGDGNHLGIKIKYKTESGKDSALFEGGDNVRISMSYKKRDDYQNLVINIYKRSGEHLTGFRIPADGDSSEVEVRALFAMGKYYTLIQAVTDDHKAVGGTVMGPEFAITTEGAPGVPNWSGLVPVDYKVIKQKK
jgi:ABC-2 type transport system ATP-binding protein